ncbi:MAG: TrmH family RNA methyltransferase [Gammaproteobacteria bacterium]
MSEEKGLDPNKVDHLRHPAALVVRELLTREGREKLKQIIIDDEENILQALNAGVVLESVLTTDPEQLTLALPEGVPVLELSKRTGKKLFGNEKVSRVFAIAKLPEPLTLDSLSKIEGDYIVLDNLTISGNIGAITRTSAALGVGALVLLGCDAIDIYDRRVIRASRGFIFKLPVLGISSEEFIQHCHQTKTPIVVTTSYTDDLVDQLAKEARQLAIVFGSEKQGCSQTIIEAADIKVKIPMEAGVESLNVSAAAGIVLYLRRQQ